MADDAIPTIETSLDILAEVVGGAADDLRAVREVVDRVRANLSSRHVAASREIVLASTRAVQCLRDADEALRRVVGILGRSTDETGSGAGQGDA